jgi:hypothetical protein
MELRMSDEAFQFVDGYRDLFSRVGEKYFPDEMNVLESITPEILFENNKNSNIDKHEFGEVVTVPIKILEFIMASYKFVQEIKQKNASGSGAATISAAQMIAAWVQKMQKEGIDHDLAVKIAEEFVDDLFKKITVSK